MIRIPAPRLPQDQAKASRSAFSLLELLAVMAVISFLMAVILPAMHSLTQAGNLTKAGNLVADLSNEARQNSVSKGAMTALIMVTNSQNTSWNSRLFVLAQCLPGSASWTLVSPWYQLPEGVVVDQSQSNFSSPSVATPIGTLSRGGQSIAMGEYACQIYLPDGRLVTNGAPTATPSLRMVEGLLNGAAITYTGRNNYYDVSFNPLTGLPIVDRP